MTYPEIHIWGDSLARGVIYNEQKGRYAISRVRYSTALESAVDVPVKDHSVMGLTAPEGLTLFTKSECAPGGLCAIEFGGNDCDLDWAYVSEHPQEEIAAKVSLKQYQEALTVFVLEARQRGLHPLLITPPPLHAPRYFAWVTRSLNQANVLEALQNDIYSIYRWQERYSIAMRAVAEKTQCLLLDIRDAFLSHLNYEALMCIDGIHPNEEGHRLIGETVLRATAADPLMPPINALAGASRLQLA